MVLRCHPPPHAGPGRYILAVVVLLVFVVSGLCGQAHRTPHASQNASQIALTSSCARHACLSQILPLVYQFTKKKVPLAARPLRAQP